MPQALTEGLALWGCCCQLPGEVGKSSRRHRSRPSPQPSSPFVSCYPVGGWAGPLCACSSLPPTLAPFPSEEHLQQDVGGEGEGSRWTLLCVTVLDRRSNPQAQGAGRRKAASMDWGWWSWVGSSCPCSPRYLSAGNPGPHVAKQVLNALLYLPLCREPLGRPPRPLHQGRPPRRRLPLRLALQMAQVCRRPQPRGTACPHQAPAYRGRCSCTRPPLSLRDPDALHRQARRKRPGRGASARPCPAPFQPSLPSARRPKKYEGDPQLPAHSRAQCLTHPFVWK